MSKAEKLAILAPHGVNELITPATGERFTAQDAAHALAYCSTNPRAKVGASILAMRIGGVDYRTSLIEQIMERAVEFAVQHDWRKPGETFGLPIFRRLATLALDARLDAHLCETCGGRGQYLTVRNPTTGQAGGKVVSCDSCRGTGYGEIAPTECAAALKVPLHDWRQRWAPRWRVLSEWLDGCERRASAELARALSKSEENCI